MRRRGGPPCPASSERQSDLHLVGIVLGPLAKIEGQRIGQCGDRQRGRDGDPPLAGARELDVETAREVGRRLAVDVDPEEISKTSRVETPRADVVWRKRGFAEVEMALSVAEATCEARRCLRCDLEFTKPKVVEEETVLAGGTPA